jgi:phosphatidylserine decarboxylase
VQVVCRLAWVEGLPIESGPMEYVRLLPKKALSRFVGRLAQLEKPSWIVEKGKDWFARRYHLNLGEAEKNIGDYQSLQALFTRRLKPGARPLGAGVVHPCDGELTRVVAIEDGHLVQAKGITYSLSEFLKEPVAELGVFRSGLQLTYYLCPTDYHRVHAPLDAHVTKVTHVPGELWPVNPWSVENISQLFCRNERVVFHLSTALGPVVLVMVGATNVGEIEVTFDQTIRTNVGSSTAAVFSKTYTPPLPLKKGDELGVFRMGSSVVLIFPKDAISPWPAQGSVRLGQEL